MKVERSRLVREGPRWTRDHKGDFKRVTLPERDCDLLRDFLVAEKVETIVEIGLAYGSSALAIGEALVSAHQSRPLHVIIDPLRETTWANVGWELIQTAGLEPLSQLILQPSSQALPRLAEQGFMADEASVDGSHRFHEVFVDLYFLRKIVRPGGIVVLDDYWWPSVRTAMRYFETNMGWRVVQNAFDDGTTDPTTGVGRVQALRLPDPPFEPPFEQFQPFSQGAAGAPHPRASACTPPRPPVVPVEPRHLLQWRASTGQPEVKWPLWPQRDPLMSKSATAALHLRAPTVAATEQGGRGGRRHAVLGRREAGDE